MIIILCAFFVEAKNLIEYFGMTKCKEESDFTCYENADRNIKIAICGIGQVKASVIIGEIFTKIPKDKRSDIHIVNIGSCAEYVSESDAPFGNIDIEKCANIDEEKSTYNQNIESKKEKHSIAKVYRCIKLVNVSSGRSFYPDYFLKTLLDDANLYTVGKAYQKGETIDAICQYDTLPFSIQEKTIDINLVDMEAAAIYEAASMFLSSSNIHILKVISDFGGDIDKEHMENVIEIATPKFAKYIERLSEYLNEKNKANDDNLHCKISGELVDKYAESIHASVTMRHMLNQLVKYAELSDINIEDKMLEVLEISKEKKIDKTLGKKKIYELKQFLDGTKF